jgi:hypothetical protein
MFHVKNSTVDTFIKRKPKALLCALEHDHPDLHKRVLGIWQACDWSEPLLDRLLNAAASLAKGHVFRNGNGYQVKSQTTEEVYHVGFSGIPKEWQCDCQAYTTDRVEHTTGYGPHCKHTLAAMIANFMTLDLPSTN